MPRCADACLDVQLVKTLERRFLPYALDIVDTSFSSQSAYMDLVFELLRSRHAQHVSFRGCTSTCSHWLRQESFMYLRLHLPGGCTDDNQVPAANVESDPKEVSDFAEKLLREWLLPCRVRCMHATTLPLLLQVHHIMNVPKSLCSSWVSHTNWRVTCQHRLRDLHSSAVHKLPDWC